MIIISRLTVKKQNKKKYYSYLFYRNKSGFNKEKSNFIHDNGKKQQKI